VKNKNQLALISSVQVFVIKVFYCSSVYSRYTFRRAHLHTNSIADITDFSESRGTKSAYFRHLNRNLPLVRVPSTLVGLHLRIFTSATINKLLERWRTRISLHSLVQFKYLGNESNFIHYIVPLQRYSCRRAKLVEAIQLQWKRGNVQRWRIHRFRRGRTYLDG